MFTHSENCFIAAKLVLFCQRLAYVLGLVFARVLGLVFARVLAQACAVLHGVCLLLLLGSPRAVACMRGSRLGSCLSATLAVD